MPIIHNCKVILSHFVTRDLTIAIIWLVTKFTALNLDEPMLFCYECRHGLCTSGVEPSFTVWKRTLRMNVCSFGSAVVKEKIQLLRMSLTVINLFN